MIGDLPKTLRIGEMEYVLRADYRNVLQVFEAFLDPELEQEEKWIVSIYLLLKDFSCAEDVLQAAQNGVNIEDAIKQISWFISAGAPDKGAMEKPTYNWIQDEQLIFSAINKVAGKETREMPYLHWWTFLGYFNEIGEGTFSFIVGIRHKLNKGKKLEKHERDFVARNPELIKISPPKTMKQMVEEAERKVILDEVL